MRAKISGSGEMPRVAVFRSARHIYSQAIDDAVDLNLCAPDINLGQEPMININVNVQTNNAPPS